MVFERQHVIALQISPEIFANYCPVVMKFPAIMVLLAMVKLVDAVKRTESHNIMVKVVICRLHVVANHVKIMVNVMARLKQMVLRSVS